MGRGVTTRKTIVGEWHQLDSIPKSLPLTSRLCSIPYVQTDEIGGFD